MVLHEVDCHTRPCTSAQCHPNRTQKMIPRYPIIETTEVTFITASIKEKQVTQYPSLS